MNDVLLAVSQAPFGINRCIISVETDEPHTAHPWTGERKTGVLSASSTPLIPYSETRNPNIQWIDYKLAENELSSGHKSTGIGNL
ncbi:hypothetical protein SprV_0501975700 [Sparganum proliferum]